MISQRRINSNQPATVYHCISRTISGEMLFDNQAKEILRKHLHQSAEFSGVQIITYAMMSNHFHVLVRVTEQGVLDDAELLRRYKVLHPEPSQYAKTQIEMMEAIFKENGSDAIKLRKQLLARMGDVSEFMRTFKQRYTIWFNRNHNRFGPLWAERFTSTIIEDDYYFAVQTVAAYIDLNPVRAGIVQDPKNYRWCGYGEAEATGGGKIAEGLRRAVSDSEHLGHKELLAKYRLVLFGRGVLPKRGDSKSARISSKNYERELNPNSPDSQLPHPEHLQARIGSISRGAIIGRKPFVEKHLAAYRKNTRKRLRTPARPVSRIRDEDAASPALYTMRGKR